MSNIPVLPLLLTTGPQAVSQSTITGSPTELPPALVKLPTGTLVTGFIINRDQTGNPVIRTEGGDVLLQSDIFLRIGSEVVFRLEQTGNQPRARLITVDGQTPQQAAGKGAAVPQDEISLPANSSTTSSTASHAAQAAIPPSRPLPPPGTVYAQLLSLAQQNTQLPGILQAQLSPGTQLLLKLLPEANSPTASNRTQPASSVDAAPESAVAAKSAPPSVPQTPAAPMSYAAYGKQSFAWQAGLPPVQAVIQGVNTAAAPEVAQPATLNPVTLPAAAPLPQQAGVPSPAMNAAIMVNQLPVQDEATLPPPAPQAPVSAPAAESPMPGKAPPTAPVVTPMPASSLFFRAGDGSVPAAFAAQILQVDMAGQAIAQTPLGTIRLPALAGYGAGSIIQAELVDVRPNPLPGAPVIPTSPATLAAEWASLKEIVTLLSQQTPSASQQWLQQSLPWLGLGAAAASGSDNGSMATGLMFFISALRGGDFRSWLGERNSKIIEELGRKDLLQKAESEFGLLRNMAMPSSNAATQQPGATPPWQAMFFPVAMGQELQQARMFWRKEKREEQKGRTGEGTRFIVDMDMSSLGEIQMDGFVKKFERVVYFDLMIRSQHEMDAQMKHDILNIFEGAGELTGYKGSLQFLNVKEFPIKPLDELFHPQNTAQASPPPLGLDSLA